MAMARLRATTGVGATPKQLVVQGNDLRPVGLLDRQGIRVHDVDGRLELIETGARPPWATMAGVRRPARRRREEPP
jgi:hypothetical protein